VWGSISLLVLARSTPLPTPSCPGAQLLPCTLWVSMRDPAGQHLLCCHPALLSPSSPRPGPGLHLGPAALCPLVTLKCGSFTPVLWDRSAPIWTESQLHTAECMCVCVCVCVCVCLGGNDSLPPTPTLNGPVGVWGRMCQNCTIFAFLCGVRVRQRSPTLPKDICLGVKHC
jgi:hypothetical protein